jgi:phosphatidylglycerol:prolipoprotein diacylglycerol transferase
MIDITPGPVALQIGPFSVFWYGIGYALGLAVAYAVMSWEARRRGHDPDVLVNGLIVVAVAALIGGRAYHVIDQWQNLYASDPIKVVLPPYTGLGVYGGLITGTIGAFVYARWRRVSFWTWTDIVAPGLFAMQAIARWGNFFNQELYGPPTTLPWGIAIQCDHRIAAYACPPGSDPTATLGQHFQPLFLYESLAGLAGLIVVLFLARRFGGRLRTGELLGVFFVWYGIVRFALETQRADNWTFFTVPTAQIVSALFVLAGFAVIVGRRRTGPTLAAVDADARGLSEAARLAATAKSVEESPTGAHRGDLPTGGAPPASDLPTGGAPPASDLAAASDPPAAGDLAAGDVPVADLPAGRDRPELAPPS